MLNSKKAVLTRASSSTAKSHNDEVKRGFSHPKTLIGNEYKLFQLKESKYIWIRDSFTIEYPTGSGKEMNLREIAMDLCDRLIKLFMPRADGSRAPPPR